jgi:4-amino-4-deoxy-L-arabinose transferase-like glycosyltransferase
MDDLKEDLAPAEADQPDAAGDAAASSLEHKTPGEMSQGRRALFLLLTLAGLVWAVEGQVQLSAYAVSGGGAAQVTAPPLTVVFSLVACLLVAVALTWHERRKGDRARTASWPAVAPDLPRPTLAEWLRAAFDRLLEIWAAPFTPGMPAVRAAWREWLCGAGVALALIASLVADVGAQTLAGRPVAQWWWVGSVALLLVSVGGFTWLKHQRRKARRARRAETAARLATPAAEAAPQTFAQQARRFWGTFGDGVLVGVLLVVGLALRLPDLANVPYILHGDEAACGLEAYRWLNGGVPSLISVGWYGLPVLGYGIPALVMKIVGAGLFGLRLSSVIIGLLAIALLYALAREFLGRRAAFLAAGLFTVAHISIQFSRMGIHYIHAPFAVLLTLWMLVRSLRKNNAFAAVVAGVGLSLALQVYFSARIIFLIVPLFLAGLLLFRPRLLRGRLAMIGWMLLSFIVSFGPMGVYFLHDQDAFKSRSAEVLILNMTQEMRDHLISQFHTVDLWAIIPRQLAAVPLLMGGLPDQSYQYGPFYPLFDPLVAALVTIGFFYALLHLKRPLCLLLVIWVLCTVTLGGVLTIDMPWWPRLLVMVPALCLLAAVAVEAILRVVARAWLGLEWALAPGDTGQRWRSAALAGMLALAVVSYSAGQSIQHYFTDYGPSVNGTPWRALYTDIARYAARLPAGTQVLLFSDDSIIWDYEPIRFLDRQVSGQRTGDAQTLLDWLSNRSGPTVIIVTLSQQEAFHALLITSSLPSGDYRPQNGPDGKVAFYTYTLSG